VTCDVWRHYSPRWRVCMSDVLLKVSVHSIHSLNVYTSDVVQCTLTVSVHKWLYTVYTHWLCSQVMLYSVHSLTVYTSDCTQCTLTVSVHKGLYTVYTHCQCTQVTVHSVHSLSVYTSDCTQCTLTVSLHKWRGASLVYTSDVHRLWRNTRCTSIKSIYLFTRTIFITGGLI